MNREQVRKFFGRPVVKRRVGAAVLGLSIVAHDFAHELHRDHDPAPKIVGRQASKQDRAPPHRPGDGEGPHPYRLRTTEFTAEQDSGVAATADGVVFGDSAQADVTSGTTEL